MKPGADRPAWREVGPTGRAGVRTLHARAQRAGTLAMIGSMACFVANDALVKYASQQLPAAQLIFLRNLVASGLVLALAHALGATPRIRAIGRGWVPVRSAFDAVATLLFLLALFNLPISTATAINMTAPLIITALAPLVAGARAAPPPWLATALGFAGVLLIVQPRSESFNAYSLVCLAATVVASVRDLLTRRVPPDVPSILVTLSTMLAVTLLAGVLSLFQGWGSVRPAGLALITAAAALLAAGYFLLVTSLRHGDVSFVAPFRYSALPFAMVIGYLVWDELPNTLAWCGIVLLVGSGLYVLRAGSRLPVESSLDGPA